VLFGVGRVSVGCAKPLTSWDQLFSIVANTTNWRAATGKAVLSVNFIDITVKLLLH
jgi:hypothetical protein